MNTLSNLIEKIDRQNLWDNRLELNRKEFVKVKGTVDTNLYFVVSGSLRIYVLEEFEENIIRFGYKNNFIASLDSFISEKPSDLYIQAIKRSIERSNTGPNKMFRSGILGNYFAEIMLPKEKLSKMKTFEDKNPLGSRLDKTTIARFISQQEELLNLLDKSRQIDLNKTKTAISISKWIKLKIGDTFRVVVYHNERHIVQANKIQAVKVPSHNS